MTCQARNQGQEWHCLRCRMRWDSNDPDPPVCGKLAPIVPEAPIKEKFVSGLPDALTFRN